MRSYAAMTRFLGLRSLSVGMFSADLAAKTGRCPFDFFRDMMTQDRRKDGMCGQPLEKESEEVNG